MTLSDIQVGKTYQILSVHSTGLLKQRLLEMGFVPQTVIKILKVAPLGDPIQIQLRHYHLTLRKADAKFIEVREIDDE